MSNLRSFTNGVLDKVGAAAVGSSFVPPGRSKDTPWYSVLGDTLLVADGSPKPTAELLGGKKVVGLYFSAGWCGPCTRFKPYLTEFYRKAKQAKPEDLELVFLSACTDPPMFAQTRPTLAFPAVPWEVAQGPATTKAAGFVRKAVREAGKEQGVLGAKFSVSSVPRLVIVDGATGSAIVPEAHENLEGGGYRLLAADGSSPAEQAWNELVKTMSPANL